MSWEGKTVSELREEFVKRVLSKEKSKSALCREYGISRPTGDKWIHRYENGEGFDDRSRRPFHTPNKIPESDEERIIEARKKEPALGARKIRRILINEKWDNPPSISTFNAVFKRNGLITKEASEQATPYKRFEKDAPNMMWQADFKGNYALGNGQRCHPLSLIDDCSRFNLNADAKPNEQLAGTKASFEKAFREYGLPDSILCDNGTPWGSSQTTSITRFEVWLMELGILTIHIRPKHPQTQGKVERFNGSFKRERLKFYTPKDLEDAQRQRDEYRYFYNNVRPHEALNDEVPAKHYCASRKRFPFKIEEWVYPCNYAVRNIKSSGYFNFNGQGYFLSEGLGDKTVAIVESCQDGLYDIIFRQFRIAKLDVKKKVIISRRVYLLQDDPRSLKKV